MTWSSAFLGPLTLLAVTLLLVAAFLFGLYRFLRWLWGRVPAAVVSTNPDQLAKSLGLLLSLVLFPSLVGFAWNTVQALVVFLSQFVRRVSTYPLPPACRNPDETGTSSCASDITLFVSGTLGDGFDRLVQALQLAKFPAADFVWFLLVALVSARVLRTLYDDVTIERVRSWYAATRGSIAIPVTFWQQLAFTALVLVSFYLGLSALLAIPLFQDKSRPQQLTVETLGKALEANIIKADVLDRTFPAEPFSLIARPPLNVEAGFPIGKAFQERFDSEIQNQDRAWRELTSAWVALRETAATGPATWRDQAVVAFAAGLEISTGKKQTAQHYNDLLVWHQRSSQQTRTALSQCLTGLRMFVGTASEVTDAIRQQAEQATREWKQSAGQVLPPVQTPNAADSYREALRSCTQVTLQEPMPERPPFARVLGPIGQWTSWLLDTEQMPVVIIVGLVGFSLLGATVSRAVRARGRNLRAALTLDDLLAVIAGGMTAAVVVFLAAYGGLAVLGNASGDPNPYVVFVTCLIGAVYSEDVWLWARNRLLATRQARNDEGQPEPAGGQTSPAARPEDKTQSKGA